MTKENYEKVSLTKYSICIYSEFSCIDFVVFIFLNIFATFKKES